VQSTLKIVIIGYVEGALRFIGRERENKPLFLKRLYYQMRYKERKKFII
jgi:hypothetical protein